MPNKRIGRVIYHKVGGRWKVKQRCTSVTNAKKALNLLSGVEHGWKPTGKKSSAKRRSKRGERRKHG